MKTDRLVTEIPRMQWDMCHHPQDTQVTVSLLYRSHGINNRICMFMENLKKLWNL